MAQGVMCGSGADVNFEECFSRLIGHEGDLSMDPVDPGNWTGGAAGKGALKGTRFGISAASFPGEDIQNLPIDRALQIYKTHYWGPAGCDAVPDAARFDLFDMAVNSGVRTAVKNLQRAVGEVDDGVLGPRTLQAIQSMPSGRLVARFNGYRILYITAMPDQWWSRFGRGLMNRIASNLKDA